MAKNSEHSASQRKAYYTGMGYSVAHKDKKIRFTSDELKESFMAGYRAGSAKVKKSPKKYPDLK